MLSYNFYFSSLKLRKCHRNTFLTKLPFISLFSGWQQQQQKGEKIERGRGKKKKKARVRVFKDFEISAISMAMKNFYNEIRGLKVKDLPAHLKPMFTLDYVKKTVSKGMDNYHAKYIQTSSIDPLLHVCFGGMAFSYLVALPEERRHLAHQQHAKEHGGH